MNQQKRTDSKTSQVISDEKTARKPTENKKKGASYAASPKYGAHSGLKFNFNVKKETVVEPFSFDVLHENRKVNQQKETPEEISAPKPTENAMKSTTNTERRKYGAHSGLKFNFNVKKLTVVEPFSFDVLHENRKGTSSTRTAKKQVNVERNFSSAEVKVPKSMEMREESGRSNNKIQSSSKGSLLQDCATSSGGESNISCRNVAKPLCAVKPLIKIPNTMKTQLSNKTNAQPNTQILNDLRISSLTTVDSQRSSSDVKILQSNATKPQQQFFNVAKPQHSKVPKLQALNVVKDAKICHKKYGAHSGMKLKQLENVKKTTEQLFSIDNRCSSPDINSTNSEAKQAQSKEMDKPEGGH